MSEEFECIVIGGGPGGSTAASFLRLMGRKVLLLERAQFPRHHIGESMIAATIDVLAEIGLEEKLASVGFPVKSGGCFIWGDSQLPWCIRFEEVPGRATSYQVKRDVFDALLLDHCSELGVDVRQRHRVRDVLRDEEGSVQGVVFQRPDGTTGEARAPITIDASGLSAVVANRVSKRVAAEELQNVALYGYWKGEHVMPASLGGEIRATDRYNIIIKWLGPGWLWFIPLGLDNLISVGYVAPRDTIPSGGTGVLKPYLLERISSSPEISKLLSSCTYSDEFHAIRDWSYRSERMAGKGYFAVGDAACFVDPILSSGVFLAVLYAKMCACAVNTSLQKPEMTSLVQEWYEALYSDSYQDYLQMAHYWYHGDRTVSQWMREARNATEEDTQYSASDRSSFLGLATGNVHAHPGYVHREKLESLKFPARLRKDPLLGQLRAMGNALFAHGPGADQDDAAANVRKTLGASVEQKARAFRLMTERPPIFDRLAKEARRPRPDQPLAMSANVDVSVEVVEECVALTVVAGGRRRVLDAADTRLLDGLTCPATPSELVHAGYASEEQVYELCADLLEAGVLVEAHAEVTSGTGAEKEGI